jgi:hypothetical protein
MGREAVPYILEEFRKGRLDNWFWALYAITGENPITEEIAGDIEKMAEAWLQWGRKTGNLSDSSQHMKPGSQTCEKADISSRATVVLGIIVSPRQPRT